MVKVLCDVCMIFLKERERRKEGVIVVSCWGIFVCLETLLTNPQFISGTGARVEVNIIKAYSSKDSWIVVSWLFLLYYFYLHVYTFSDFMYTSLYTLTFADCFLFFCQLLGKHEMIYEKVKY